MYTYELAHFSTLLHCIFFNLAPEVVIPTEHLLLRNLEIKLPGLFSTEDKKKTASHIAYFFGQPSQSFFLYAAVFFILCS